MAAGTWTVCNDTRTLLLNGTFATTGSFKVGLLTSAASIDATATTWAAVAATGEVSSTNTGYTTGGVAVTLALTGTTSVAVSATSNPVWTAGSANLAAKWAVLYELGGNVVCFVLLDSGGATVTTTSGNTLTITVNSSYPFFTLA